MGLNTDAILSDIKNSYSHYDDSNELNSNYKYLAVKRLIDETDYDFEGVTINYAFNGVIEMVKMSSHECFAIAEPKSATEASTYVDASDNACESIMQSIASMGWR